ncbi:Release factor glutamine methyltransferase [Nocardia sp. RB56]|uniref:Release factor glutamine methyltransferase n=1 Tax=Nocardia aurantia TaxID=2585199 RepID=A0A7K0E255_9NOCA|nr:Release factor glutamine methyltransferase [Nocardia aurantia]
MTDPETLVARLRAAGCVFAEEEAALLIAAAASSADLESMVAQRVSGQPLEHLLGWAEFRGLRVAVTPGVFVPRQRTGYLVEQAVEQARSGRRSGPPRDCVVLDMCCGCGALGLAAATELHAAGIGVELTAADLEPAAAACARTNLTPLGASVYCGDLFAPLPPRLAGRVELLLANTPYVPTEAIAHMPPEARDHEPRTALDGGADGLDLIRRVAAAAGHWLAPGGGVFVETGAEQAAVAVKILAAHGLTPSVRESEDLGATVVCGIRP